MRISRDSIRHSKSPEYRQALQELIKYELQALVERLSATGEEALILTASAHDGTSTQFGSQKAEGFLRKQIRLGSDFLTYCNDDPTQSSADELCTYGDDLENSNEKDEQLGHKATSPIQFPTHRKRERTTSRRLSIGNDQSEANIYEVSQNSDISASERNDSASSVLSFVEAQAKAKSNLICKICSRHFRSYKTLAQHVRLHMAKSYKCGVCGKIFSVKKSYQRHFKTHSKDKLFECDICDKSFTDQYTWQRHRERHLGVRNYSCNLCGKAFYEKYSLRVHQTSHFYSALKFDKNSDATSGYPCHICQKMSKTKTALKNHLLTHSAKKHTCEFCNKRFSLRYSYVRHRRIHTGEKPYKCGSCDRSFSDGSAWAKHVRTHSGIKPFSCDVCSKSFFDKTACKTHMKVHQGKKLLRQAENEKRNFQMVSAKAEDLKYSSEKLLQGNAANESSSKKNDYEISDCESRIFDEDLNLDLVSSKGYNESSLLDSSFPSDLIQNKEKDADKEKIYEDKKSAHTLIDLDEKFQTDFVERNMPMKVIESDNEFISTTFPDDSDILADETETEIQNEAKHSSPEKNTSIQVKKDFLSEKYADTTPKKGARKTNYRRATVGKLIPDSPAKCKKCHRIFKQESLLKQHLQFHCMMKLYKCRYCGKQLSTKHSLVRHERIHIGDRPYQCYICQKTFADNYGCIRHIKHHINDGKGSPQSAVGANIRFSNSQGTNENTEIPGNLDAGANFNLAGNNLSENSISKMSSPTYEKQITTTEMPHFQEKILTTPSSRDQTYSETGTICEKANYTFNLKETNSLLKQNNHLDNNDKMQLNPVCVASSEAKVTENKQLYKCYLCASLFEYELLCIEHIQNSCSVKSKADLKIHVESLTTNTSELKKVKNLYQCSLCLKMFADELTCQTHVNQQCSKTQLSTECAVQSILQDTLPFTDITEPEPQEPLPSLPFPEINQEQNFLKISDADVVILSDNYNNSIITPCTDQITTSAVESHTVSKPQPKPPAFLGFNQLPTPVNNLQRSPSTVPNTQVSPATDISVPFTAIVQKPVMSLNQGKFLVTNKGLSLVGSSVMHTSQGGVKSVVHASQNVVKPAMNASQSSAKSDKSTKKPESDISERTCSICIKVFTTKHILKQHTLIHMEKKFGCKYCMKKFHNKYGRDRHERIHTGEKPFSCPNCKKAFSDNSTYRKHTRVCCSGK